MGIFDGDFNGIDDFELSEHRANMVDKEDEEDDFA